MRQRLRFLVELMARLKESSVERFLASAPALKAAAAGTENQVTVEQPLAGLQDGDHRYRQRNHMLALVLGAGRWQRYDTFLEVDFGPSQTCNLVAPLPCQCQQLDDVAV